jgi:pimeloyl-ACP methyl ester carboxylesterase
MRHSGRLATVSLVNAFGILVEGHPIARFFDAAAPDPLAGRRAVRDLLFADPEAALAQEVLPDTLDLDRATTFFTHVHAAARIGWQPPAFYDPRLRERLGRITAPMLIVWGASNVLVDVTHGEAYAAGIPGASLHVLDGVGHAAGFEQPKEVAELVTSFVEEHQTS